MLEAGNRGWSRYEAVGLHERLCLRQPNSTSKSQFLFRKFVFCREDALLLCVTDVHRRGDIDRLASEWRAAGAA